MTDVDNHNEIIHDLLDRGMTLWAGDDRSLTKCPCGYFVEVDWNDSMFGRLHDCDYTKIYKKETQ